LKRDEVTRLESKVVEVSAELKASKSTCEEVINDNAWLKEQVESMRRELGELDELLNSNLNEMREESERQQLEHERLLQEIHRYDELLRQSQDKVKSLEEQGVMLATNNEAISKTLLLTEGELLSSKKELAAAHQREKLLAEQKREIEFSLQQLQRKHVTVDSQTTALQEKLQTQEAKLHLIITSSRQEMENVKIKLNSFIEKYEEAEARVSELSKRIQESEKVQNNLREAYQKAKSALEEAKQRCCKDTDTIKKLLEERQSLEIEREVIVEKYNRVHDMLNSLKKDSVGKFADEAQKLS
ncbi:BRCT domain-containing protein, partial [Trypanosoma conorhini]